MLDPTARLLDACEAASARLTIMAELGEYFWLQQHEPKLADAMQAQWVEAIGRGHGVELHLHLSWLPELGARFDGRDYHWPQDYLKADDYPGDLTALIGRCKAALEAAIRPVRPEYAVTCFRAGAYQVQPWRRLHDALVANGILCDTSVFAGGVSAERGYDFRLAWSEHQPYLASPWDAQLLAPPGEGRVLELPVFTPERGRRWLFDGDEGPHVARRLAESRHAARPSPRAGAGRAPSRVSGWLWGGEAGPDARRGLNRLLPRRLAQALVGAPSEPPLARDYFVMIGHSKGDLRFAELERALTALRDMNVRFVTLSEMAARARADLERRSAEGAASAARGPGSEARESALRRARCEGLARAVWRRAPWDRDRVLEIVGDRDLPGRAAVEMPWTQAQRLAEGDRGGALTPLPCAAEAFDLVHAGELLALQPAVDAALAEIGRVLREGGALVCAIPSDARNPTRARADRLWKASPHDVALRLAAAGFVNLEMDERDGYRELGLPPDPSADDRVMLVRAWKRAAPTTRLERALEAMAWVYRRLDPRQAQASNDPRTILHGGFAWCAGYNVVLARLLQREGYSVTWVTMEAEGHPRGRGPAATDSHEVLELSIEGSRYVLDPTANTCHPHPLAELLARPELAGPKASQDERYRERGYELYDTAFWYSRVVRYCLRSEPDRDPCVFRPVAGRAQHEPR